MNMSNNQLMTMFVIEDDDVDFKLLMRAFKRRKITNLVVRAVDGVDAIEKLENGKVAKPFIILLDLNMPRMNGNEFLKALRKTPAFKESVVFVLTTSSDQADIQQSFSQHVAGYFLKDEAFQSIDKIVEVIDGYWQIVQLPS